MNNHLIYYSFGYKNKEKYLHLLKISILTLIETGYTGDILIIIDNNTLISFIKNAIPIANQLLFCNVDSYSSDIFLQNSPTSKLLIQQFEHITKYKKIIFCDVDTIWVSSPQAMFDATNDSGISFGNGLRYPTEVLMSNEIGVWGGWLLNKDEKLIIQQQGVLGSNSGVFSFTHNNCYVLTETYNYMKHVIESIRNNNENTDNNFINIAINRNLKYGIEKQKRILNSLTLGIEQPFINVCTWRLNKYNRNLIDLAYSGGSRTTFFKDFIENKFTKMCVVHFPDNVGSFHTKINYMNNFLRIIKNRNLNI